MTAQKCCLSGFEWSGEPQGEVIPFPTTSNQAYKTGSSSDVAILFVHDLVGWKYRNARLLADHYAREVGATVYLPDLNSREIREPEIFACARKLRSEYKKVGAVGFCWGGWAVFRLGAKGNNLVDCVIAGHPSILKKEDIDNVDVPVQLLAPEHDPPFSPELKDHFWRVTQARGDLAFDYQHFAGMAHGALVRGDEEKPGEQRAMTRAKNAAVGWFAEWLHTE
ncbi:hypothetical protein M409DRAFT_64109 [Zasmidium cellare ATCC 36951]|uniref:Dienelactone hydrolase domain-containing protein n=1 Tax=Zasmidium cellare ATCC 36951 TaxID=1080233 RepID=A0A6A6CY80_ZASCE|nr:uncharacterized protein M409DRAFT_64109 [Zasmidium cellare ATCC 36951]KAF2170326.1 hypothetical protein M409DRAFT_64109 [Zasmidium cellare ATCC 36951]